MLTSGRRLEGLFLGITGLTRQTPRSKVDTLPNGLVQVENSPVGRWNEETRWVLEEDLRLGRREGGGPDQFGSVAALRIAPNGDILVLDGLDLELRVFDSGGDFSKTIGGRGEGPGEFKGPLGLGISPEGRLWVDDPGNARYSVFDPSGAFETSYRREIMAVMVPSLSRFAAGHGYVDWGIDRSPGDSRSTNRERWSARLPIVFTPPDRYDTLPALRYRTILASDGRRAPGSGSQLVHLSRDGTLYFASPDEYRIWRRSLEGDTTLVFSLDVEVELRTGAELDSILAGYREGRRAMLERRDVYPTKPLIRKIFTDGAGHVFVIPSVPGIQDGAFIDVFEDSGRYVGRLSAPEPISFPVVSPIATDTHLYALVPDDLGVSYVVRWRIRKPERQMVPSGGGS